MNRHRKLVLSIALAASALLAGLAASSARAASLTMVTRSTWAGSVTLPSYVQMYIYVPDKMAAKPPIVVSAHACGSTATGQIGNIPMFKAAADSQGFILILPDNPGQNCWDVGSDASLTHDGGGDTQAVATMVKYALMKYGGDAGRVYIMGGSSGAMLTQGMLAVYPDVFRAGAARAGVAAGCWRVSYDPSPSQEWSNPCAKGMVSNTAMAWGDMVRKMYPGYTGHRPRVQLMQGESDGTIDYENMGESIKEWTNVLGLPMTPTSTDMSFKGAVTTWDRQFWKNSCGYQVMEAWSAPGQGHSMSYEEAAMLTFFGLTTGSTMDPEPDCTGGGAGGGSGSGMAGSSGTGSGGSIGSGGTMGAGGGSGPKDGGMDAVTDGGAPDAATGSGGTMGVGTGSGGAVGSGGTKAGAGGVTGSGGSSAIATGGSASGGTHAGSGGNGSGGTVGSGGSSSSGSGSGGAPSASGGSSSGGCAVAGDPERSVPALTLFLLVTVGAVIRRRRR